MPFIKEISTPFAPRKVWVKKLLFFQLLLRLRIKLPSRFNYLAICALFMSFVSKGCYFMMLDMGGTSHNLKVFWRIVKSIFINMMDNLMAFKLSSKNFLHNKSMLKNSSTFYLKHPIALLHNATFSFFSYKDSVWIPMSKEPLKMFSTITLTKNWVSTILYSTSHSCAIFVEPLRAWSHTRYDTKASIDCQWV